jgi:hypothetical protein
MASYFAPDPEPSVMLALAIEDFHVELNEGSLSNVGPPTKSASVKLYDVESAEAREFGDKRVKLAFADDDGNEVEVALFPEDALAIRDHIQALEDESPVFD